MHGTCLWLAVGVGTALCALYMAIIVGALSPGPDPLDAKLVIATLAAASGVAAYCLAGTAAGLGAAGAAALVLLLARRLLAPTWRAFKGRLNSSWAEWWRNLREP